MSVEVVMPQMGESITEGTVSKWLKSVGEHVGKDEPILKYRRTRLMPRFQAPAKACCEIRHNEGDTVEVGTVVAVINRGRAACASDNAASSNVSDVPLMSQSGSNA